MGSTEAQKQKNIPKNRRRLKVRRVNNTFVKNKRTEADEHSKTMNNQNYSKVTYTLNSILKVDPSLLVKLQ